MTSGYVKYRRNYPVCDPWDSPGNDKNAISVSIAYCPDLSFFYQK